MDLIKRKTLADEIRSLRVTITGLRAEKGALATYATEYRDAVLQIIDEQPAVEPERASTDEMMEILNYKPIPGGYQRRDGLRRISCRGRIYAMDREAGRGNWAVDGLKQAELVALAPRIEKEGKERDPLWNPEITLTEETKEETQ